MVKELDNKWKLFNQYCIQNKRWKNTTEKVWVAPNIQQYIKTQQEFTWFW